jgi:hypothetical protein
MGAVSQQQLLGDTMEVVLDLPTNLVTIEDSLDAEMEAKY